MSKKGKNKYTVTCPRGKTLSFTYEPDDHAANHGVPLENLIDAIADPVAVYKSKSHSQTREVYFGYDAKALRKSKYTKVVVGITKQNPNKLHLVTAITQRKIEGNIGDDPIWTKIDPQNLG